MREMLARWFSTTPPPAEGDALYAAIVGVGRRPHWYLQGGVSDTMSGRFNMISTVLALVLLRLEADPAARIAAVRLTERFVEDMEGQLRQDGVGDTGVGKQMGELMSLLGGRLGAYRDALTLGGFEAALARNLYAGAPPPAASAAHARERLLAFWRGLLDLPTDELLAGVLP